MAMLGQEFRVKPGTTISHSTFLHGDLTDGSYCETVVLELIGGRKIGCQATQTVYEITVLEEYAKLNDLMGTITVASGLSAKVADLSLTDSVKGTYMWTHLEECPGPWCSCPQGQQDLLQPVQHSGGRAGPDGGQGEGASGQPRVGDDVSVVRELSPAHSHPQHRGVCPPGSLNGGDHWEVGQAACRG
jgi:hypothetical protein